MRNPIAALTAWLRPARGKRHAAEPAQAVHLVPLSTPRLLHPSAWVEGDSLPLVPWYLVDHECLQEARRQRDRRRALALATMGQDYVPERTA